MMNTVRRTVDPQFAKVVVSIYPATNIKAELQAREIDADAGTGAPGLLEIVEENIVDRIQASCWRSSDVGQQHLGDGVK
jgi:hypothetical protein